MTLPNFLIIGAPRSGTTTLFALLKQHPQIYFPKIKEPSFFSAEGEILKTERLDFLQKSVNKIADTGLIVMLDLHECPGHDFDEAIRSEQAFFTDKSKREAAKLIWVELCRRFGDNPQIYLELLKMFQITDTMQLTMVLYHIHKTG